MTPDRNGRIPIRIPHPDVSGPTVDGSDVLVAVTVALGGGAEAGLPHHGLRASAGGHPRTSCDGNVHRRTRSVTVQIGGVDPTVAMGAAVFSDDDREAVQLHDLDSGTGAATAAPATATRSRSPCTTSTADTYRGTSTTSYRFGLTPSGGTADADINDDDPEDTVYATVASNGRARIVYTSPASRQVRSSH